jgi:hypothetical protein
MGSGRPLRRKIGAVWTMDGLLGRHSPVEAVATVLLLVVRCQADASVKRCLYTSGRPLFLVGPARTRASLGTPFRGLRSTASSDLKRG